MAGILLWSSAVRVHDSQAYRKMDVTREHISHILELREILLSIQTGFSLVSAAVVCAILESISGLEPSSVITEPNYLKLVTVSSFCPFTLISVLMQLVLFVISLVLADGLGGEEEELANLVERLDKASTAYGMEISAEKTKLMTKTPAASTQRSK